MAAAVGGRPFSQGPLAPPLAPPRGLPRAVQTDAECVESDGFTADACSDHSLFSKMKESSLSVSLTAALILVASIVVIVSSITIQSAYMWLAVGATAVLFLAFCSCTACEDAPWVPRRASDASASPSPSDTAAAADPRDELYEVNHVQSCAPYWLADLPPSYAAATAPVTPAVDCALPPPYAAVAGLHFQGSSKDESYKQPLSSIHTGVMTARGPSLGDTRHLPSCPCHICITPLSPLQGSGT